MSDDDLRGLIARSRSISHVFEQLDLRKSGASFRTFRSVAEAKAIDTSHFIKRGDPKGYIKSVTRTPGQVFVEDSHVAGVTLRRKIRQLDLKPYRCERCGNDGHWQGRDLVLPLDHINGRRTDNRLDNLRFLCPNCHSQTETYCGRKPKRVTTAALCPDCGGPYRSNGRRCRRCSARLSLLKVPPSTVLWSSDDELRTLVWQQSLVKLGARFGCSDSAVRKRCRLRSIPIPGVGYWRRREVGMTHEQALDQIGDPTGNRTRVC